MRTRQHSRRHTTRLLLLAAATTAGIGIALALSDEANAADSTPAADGIAATLRGAISLGEAAQPSPPVRRLVDQTRPAVDKATTAATRAVKRTTDRVDQVAKPLPVVGSVVDRTTDVTDRALDTSTMLPPAPPRTAAIDVSIHLPLDRPAASGPQTAPEPTTTGPPTPPAASSSAPTIPTLLRETKTPAVDGHPTCRPDTSSPAAAASTATRIAGGSQLGHGDGAANPTRPTVKPLDATSVDRWSGSDRWQQAITAYIADRDGRTDSPSPPSG